MNKITQMLGNFENEPGAAVADFEGIENGGQLIIELNIHNGTNNSNDTAIGDGCLSAQQLWGGEVPYWTMQLILAPRTT